MLLYNLHGIVAKVLAPFVIDGGQRRPGETQAQADARATLVYGGKQDRSAKGRGLVQIPSRNPYFVAFHTELDQKKRTESFLVDESNARKSEFSHLIDDYDAGGKDVIPSGKKTKKSSGEKPAKPATRRAIDGENYFVIRNNNKKEGNIPQENMDALKKRISWQASCFEGAKPKDCLKVGERIAESLLPLVTDPSKSKVVKDVGRTFFVCWRFYALSSHVLHLCEAFQGCDGVSRPESLLLPPVSATCLCEVGCF